MKLLLEVMSRVFIFFIVLLMGLVPVGTAFAAPVLNLAMATNTGPVAPGQNVTFIITASNTGDTVTGSFTLLASVPNNTTVPAAQDEAAGCGSAGATNVDCLAGQSLVWNISLGAGQSLTRTFSAVVDSVSPPPNGTVITSTASTTLGLAVNASVIVRSAAGLNLTLDSIPNSVAPGGEYLYRLTYGNAGFSSVNTDLTFSLPAGANITSASDGGVIIGATVTWNVGDLPAGIIGMRDVLAQIPVSTDVGILILAGAQLSDNAGVQEPAAANAVTTVATLLELAVSTLPDPVQPGQNVSYVVTVSNTSAISTGNAVLYARVPNHTMVPAAQDEGAGCGSTGATNVDCLAGQSLAWNIFLGAGESMTRTFTAVVDSISPPANGTLLSTVVNVNENNGAGVTAEVVVGDAGSMLALDVPPGSITPGGSYTYTLTYSNAGASAVTGELLLRLPLGTTFQSASGGGTFAGGVVTWAVGALSPGQSDRQQVTLQAPVSSAGSILMAEAQLRDPTTLQSHARASALATVATPLELAVSTLPDPVQPGQNVSYVVTVSNTSAISTGNAVLYARVPNHTMVPAAQDEGAGCGSTGATNVDCLAGQSLAWNIFLGAGESMTRTFTAVVDSISPPANGTLLSTVVNVNENNGAGVTAEVVVGVDTDGDGVNDASDNCTLIANSDQRDTDNDGFGNICDPDLDNNLIVNAADLAIFKPLFFTTDPDANFDGIGTVNAADLAILKSMFFKSPGPSGLAP